MNRSKRSRISGVYVPVVTPFTDAGALHIPDFKKHITWLVSKGVDGIVVGGTTGEGHALSKEEKFRLLKIAVNLRESSPTSGKFKIIAGTGSYSLFDSVMVASHAAEMGCDAVLALPPKNNDPNTITEFYRNLSKAAQGIEVFAYNIPSLTEVNLQPQSVAELVSDGTVSGLKDSSGAKDLLVKWKTLEPKTTLIVGVDSLIQFSAIETNADALVTGLGNIEPELVRGAFYLRGKAGAAAQKRIDTEVARLKHSGRFLSSLKFYMKQNGMIESDFSRAPGVLTLDQKKSFVALQELARS
jgi:dihydrodipicolinate synthase/N-acetylneuraminate lyase